MPRVKVMYWNIRDLGIRTRSPATCMNYTPLINFIAAVVRIAEADILFIQEFQYPFAAHMQALCTALKSACGNVNWNYDWVAGSVIEPETPFIQSTAQPQVQLTGPAAKRPTVTGAPSSSSGTGTSSSSSTGASASSSTEPPRPINFRGLRSEDLSFTVEGHLEGYAVVWKSETWTLRSPYKVSNGINRERDEDRERAEHAISLVFEARQSETFATPQRGNLPLVRPGSIEPALYPYPAINKLGIPRIGSQLRDFAKWPGCRRPAFSHLCMGERVIPLIVYHAPAPGAYDARRHEQQRAAPFVATNLAGLIRDIYSITPIDENGQSAEPNTVVVGGDFNIDAMRIETTPYVIFTEYARLDPFAPFGQGTSKTTIWPGMWKQNLNGNWVFDNPGGSPLKNAYDNILSRGGSDGEIIRLIDLLARCDAIKISARSYVDRLMYWAHRSAKGGPLLWKELGGNRLVYFHNKRPVWPHIENFVDSYRNWCELEFDERNSAEFLISLISDHLPVAITLNLE